MNCPYYKGIVNNTIYCNRGLATGKIEGVSVNLHTKNYCNSTYRKCRCYKYLEREWGA